MESVKLATIVKIVTPFVVALLIIIIGAILVKGVMKVMTKALEKSKLDEALYAFLKNIVKVALWILIIITALGKVGVPISTFITVIGACGAAIALALKDSLSNVAGGILILVNKPFGKGDYISVAGSEGSVEKIDLMTTTLITPDNKVVRIPNGNISNSVTTNFSAESRRRVDNTFGIGYECDIDQARKIVMNVIESNDRILKNPQPVVLIGDHGDNSVTVISRAWVNTADYWDVYFFMQEQVKKAFDEANINIPYPQVDVHMVK